MRSQQPTASARRGPVAAVVAVLAVLLIGGGYLAYARDDSGPASSVVVAYLRALARGDARGALSLGQHPPDTALLTADVLRRQQQLAPITAVTVLGTTSGDYGAVVHVRYRVGGRTVDDHVNVIRAGGSWSLEHVAVDVVVSGASYLPSPTVLGLPLGRRTDVYTFPGVLTFSSTDADFGLTPDRVVFTGPDVPTFASPKAVLTQTGRQSATAAVRRAMTACASSRSLSPPRCPQRAARPAVAGLVTGSLGWRAPTDYGGLTFTLNERHPTSVRVTGRVAFSLVYRVLPRHARHTVARSRTVLATVRGTLDLGSQPPTFRAG